MEIGPFICFIIPPQGEYVSDADGEARLQDTPDLRARHPARRDV